MTADCYAATRRATSEAECITTDMLNAIRKGAGSDDSFAKGKEALQRYAEAARHALGEGRTSPWQLMHLLIKQGAPAELIRSLAGQLTIKRQQQAGKRRRLSPTRRRDY